MSDILLLKSICQPNKEHKRNVKYIGPDPWNFHINQPRLNKQALNRNLHNAISPELQYKLITTFHYFRRWRISHEIYQVLWKRLYNALSKFQKWINKWPRHCSPKLSSCFKSNWWNKISKKKMPLIMNMMILKMRIMLKILTLNYKLNLDYYIIIATRK